MANEFKVKNGLIVDAGGAQITGGITGSTDFNTIVNKPTLISSSAQVTSVTQTVTGTNSAELVRGNMADNDQFRILVGGTATNAGFAEIATADDGTEPIYVRQYTGVFGVLVRTATLLDGSGNTSFPGTVSSPNITYTSQLGTNAGEIRLQQAAYRNGNQVIFQYSHNADSNGTRDLGFRRNNTGSLEIYDGNTVDGAVANRRDLILRNITGSNAFFSGSVNITGSLTASLTNGYTWVGNGNNVSTLVSTSSFGAAAINAGVFDFNLEPSTGTIGFIQDSGSNYTIQPTSTSVSILAGVNPFVVITSQSFSTNVSFTASLQNGHAWVGNGSGITYAVPTSSFGGGSSTNTSLNSFTSSQYVSNSFFATTGSNLFRGNQTFSGSLIPDTTNGFDLGSATNIWRDLYISTGSIKFVAGTTVVKELTLTTLTSLESATGSTNSFTASILPRLTNLETTSASANSSISQINTFTSSNANTSLNSLTASIAPRLTNLETTSASVNISISNINSFTSSNGNASLNSLTASISPRLTNLETTSASVNISVSNINTFTASNANTSLNATTASFAPRITNLETTSASVNISVSNLNTFTASNGNTSLNAATASYVRTNVSNIFSVDQTITGSLYISQNLIVQGSSSLNTISQSTLNIGTNLVTVNVQNPASRFGGLGVIDSGSSPARSGSWLFDSVNDNWIMIHQNAANITSSVALMGAPTYNNVGNETYPTLNRLVKGLGYEHIGDSQISDDGTTVSIGGALTVTGNITGPIRATNGVVSGSSQISLAGTSDYSGLFGGIGASTASLNTFSSSTNVHIVDINAKTASFETKFVTLGIVSGSLNQFTASINGWSGSIATTGSNLFRGNQNITGSLILTGSMIAGFAGIPELTVQQSGVTLGSIVTDIHRVTGSLNITGSFSASLANGFTYVGGADNITRLVATSSFGGSVTLPSGLVSGSSQITLSGTTGYSTVINQNLLTTSNVTHANLALNGTAGGDLIMTSGYPTIVFKDSDNRTGYWHMNGDQMYLLSGANGSGANGWTQVSSQWPFIFNTANNSAACGGAFTAVGDVTAYSSDRRLKENIVTIENPLEKVLKLRGVYYDWKDGLEEIGFVPQQKHDIGVIAQELEEVIPEAVKPAPFDTEKGVSKSGENYKTVQMDKIIPILIEGMKEQQKQIEELKNKIAILENNLEK